MESKYWVVLTLNLQGEKERIISTKAMTRQMANAYCGFGEYELDLPEFGYYGAFNPITSIDLFESYNDAESYATTQN